MAGGNARSHLGDGRTRDVSYTAGDTQRYIYGPGELMIHDLGNVGDTPLVFATVEFPDSAKRGVASRYSTAAEGRLTVAIG